MLFDCASVAETVLFFLLHPDKEITVVIIMAILNSFFLINISPFIYVFSILTLD